VAGRKRKIEPAVLRTLGIFTGLTPIEEAERELAEETAPNELKDRSYDGAKQGAIRDAILWLGMDMFEDGDDIMLAVGRRGDGVLLIVTGKPGETPSHQAQVRLSPKQLAKLKRIVGDLP
jgi:hypothetical protein